MWYMIWKPVILKRLAKKKSVSEEDISMSIKYNLIDANNLSELDYSVQDGSDANKAGAWELVPFTAEEIYRC